MQRVSFIVALLSGDRERNCSKSVSHKEDRRFMPRAVVQDYIDGRGGA
jgi:hypothetical protein